MLVLLDRIGNEGFGRFLPGENRVQSFPFPHPPPAPHDGRGGGGVKSVFVDYIRDWYFPDSGFLAWFLVGFVYY